MNEAWLIWSNEHKAWWKPGSSGYTNIARDAGHYSFEQARQICRDANQFRGCGFMKMEPNETMVALKDSVPLTKQPVCNA
jgi:hypothetical protein